MIRAGTIRPGKSNSMPAGAVFAHEKTRPPPNGDGRAELSLQVLEVVGDAAVIIATIRIEGRPSGRVEDQAAIRRIDARAGTIGIQQVGHPARTDVEDVVAADRELQGFGNVVPGFQIGEGNSRLIVLNIRRIAGRGGDVVLRTIISFAEGQAELVQRPVAVKPTFSDGALCTKLYRLFAWKKVAPDLMPVSLSASARCWTDPSGCSCRPRSSRSSPYRQNRSDS